MITQILQNLVRPRQLLHSQSSETTFPLQGGDESLFRTAIRGIRGMLVEARKRQIYNTEIREATEHLHGLTDEQLRDMGITRMDIAHVVRHGKDWI
jgi:uncharacterized protein YjiS (DUF1127 family)